MNRFHVVAAWLEDDPLIGICDVTAARGKERISFAYDESWLARFPGLTLDPDVYALPGRQFPPDEKPCFGFLADVAPDRWGRKLMDRRERIDAANENRPVRKLLESDYILGVHDGGRAGGIRLQDPESGSFISSRSLLAAPPLAKLRELEQAALHLELNDDPSESKWFRDLIEPGSSLGGARPKANVMDEDGHLWIAKFPSRHDDINVGAWAMGVHDLAKKAGIQVPEARCMSFSDAGATFLVKRFDRSTEKRIHYASAMTMLGGTDGTADIYDFLDIAGIIEQIGCNPEEDLRELWSRAVFHICVSNTDNHLRNHAFLMTDDGWRLSPSFDVNPAYDRETFELSIGGNNKRDLQAAINVSDYFRITKKDAARRAEEIRSVVRDNWKKLAKQYGISANEQKLMQTSFLQ